MPQVIMTDNKLKVDLSHLVPPDGYVEGPRELDNWEETQIRNRSQVTEIDPLTGTGVTKLIGAQMEYDLLHFFLESRDAEWNLEDHLGRKLPRDRQTIDKVCKGERGRAIRAAILEKIGPALMPEMFDPEAAQRIIDAQDRQFRDQASLPPHAVEPKNDPYAPPFPAFVDPRNPTTSLAGAPATASGMNGGETGSNNSPMAPDYQTSSSTPTPS